MSFHITGLDPARFKPLFDLDDAALAERGILSTIADRPNAYPDRISLRDAQPGDRLLLMNYLYQPAATPYRGAHAIYVNTAATTAFDAVGEVPPILRPRLLSLRAFGSDDLMVDADVIEGRGVEGLIDRLFASPTTAYIHVHFAKRGCFAARIDRCG